MLFDVDFNGEREMAINIYPDSTSSSVVRIPIDQIAQLLHDICNDLDMVRPQDREVLKEAINRFNHLTKVED